MRDVYAEVAKLKVVPVVVLNKVEDAVPLGKALVEGGLPIAEVTFRTDAAEESIKAMKANCPDLIVGAGTVINREMCERAIAAGAEFIVSPGFSDEVTQCAIEHNVPVLPGCCTPTEIMAALKYNLPVLKFFPASNYGGLATIKSLASVFPKVKFMPTGGVNAANVKEFLAFPKIIACGGTWMVKPAMIEAGQWDEIIALCKEAVQVVNS